MARRIALIDGDIFAYREAAATERRIKWSDEEGDETWCVEDPEIAVMRTTTVLEEVLSATKCVDAVVCLSVPSAEGFRRQVLPTYKANRSTRKPENLAVVKEHLRKDYRVVERPLLEADDLLGILATVPKSNLLPGFDVEERVMVSTDKDLMTIPGVLYNPVKRQVTRTVQDEADYRFYMQVLTGDPVDGYTGIPGIGRSKAEKILKAPNGETYGAWSMWQAVLAAYEAKGLTEADAIQQARVARILRHGEYDYKTKQPILWSPPQ